MPPMEVPVCDADCAHSWFFTAVNSPVWVTVPVEDGRNRTGRYSQHESSPAQQEDHDSFSNKRPNDGNEHRNNVNNEDQEAKLASQNSLEAPPYSRKQGCKSNALVHTPDITATTPKTAADNGQK